MRLKKFQQIEHQVANTVEAVKWFGIKAVMSLTSARRG